MLYSIGGANRDNSKLDLDNPIDEDDPCLAKWKQVRSLDVCCVLSACPLPTGSDLSDCCEPPASIAFPAQQMAAIWAAVVFPVACEEVAGACPTE